MAPPRNQANKPLLLTVLGPTASGKSDLALVAAEHLGGEIVNCDSMQLIRGMQIGTAKPTLEDQARVPHHLYDRIAPDEYFSAGAYMQEAREICRQIAGRRRVPIVVGGTGLYLRALLLGVFEGPGRSNRLRRRLQRIAELRGSLHLHRLLQRRDPEAASRIEPADRVRIVRALEVLIGTGQPISRLHKERRPLEGFQVRKIALEPDRKLLYARINARVQRMFEGGLLAEVQNLLEQGYTVDCKGFEAIGYRQAAAVVEGRLGLAQAMEETATLTRQYAKRQLTWFRKEPDLCRIPLTGDDPEALTRLLRCLQESA